MNLLCLLVNTTINSRHFSQGEQQSHTDGSANHASANLLRVAATLSTDYPTDSQAHKSARERYPDSFMNPKSGRPQLCTGLDLALTRVGNVDESIRAQQTQLHALEMELKIIQTQAQIKNSPGEGNQFSSINTSASNSSILKLVKQSVDLKSLPHG